MSCSNNIKQLAIGLHGFSDANHRLPYASHKNKNRLDRIAQAVTLGQ